MASNHTPLLGLCQWAAEDFVLHSDFNADNLALDTFLQKMPRVKTGSYIGTGTHGADDPCSLRFDFVPQLVILVEDGTSALHNCVIMIHGQEYSSGVGILESSSRSLNLKLGWQDKTVSWYCEENSQAGHQMNTINQRYCYFAVGV